MYLPAHFEETRTEALVELIRARPLGTLITLDADGLSANHIPFDYDPEPAPFGTLRAHVARGNPVWRDVRADVHALVIFQGAQSYVSPSWYPSKKETGKEVPTYNYAAVHAYGALRVVDDPAWLHALLERLTDRHETRQATPWKISDAPADYIEKMIAAVVGIEIPVTRLIGKWKVSQNKSDENRAGVVAGLRQLGDADAIAMADEVARWSKS